jgi:hypothetical protein
MLQMQLAQEKAKWQAFINTVMVHINDQWFKENPVLN